MTYANLPYDYQYLIDKYLASHTPKVRENCYIPGTILTPSESRAFWDSIADAKNFYELPEIPQAQYRLIKSLPTHYKLYVPPQARKFFYNYLGRPDIKDRYYIQKGSEMSATDDLSIIRSAQLPTLHFFNYFEVKQAEKTLPDTFKIQVNPDQSRVLQEKLFENGVSWAGPYNWTPERLDNAWLKVKNGILSIFASKEGFDANNLPEIIFEDYFPDAEPAPVEPYDYHQQLHNAAEILAGIPFAEVFEFLERLQHSLSEAADSALITVEEEVCKLRQQLTDKESELELIRSYKNNLNLQK